ncbi:MAG: hypothetical protein C0475_04650 [Planctomyces sp.]|nr:hypothetical protein [Planctomyces sp.]
MPKIVKADGSPVTPADYAAQAVIAHTLRRWLGPVTMIGEESGASLRGACLAALPGADELAWNALTQSGAWPDAPRDGLAEAIDTGSWSADAGGSAADAGPAPETYWTTDPIDGTRGFIRGHQYAVCLAKVHRGRAVLAALACPALSLDWGRPFDDPDPHGCAYAALAGSGHALEWALDTLNPSAAEPPPGRALRRPPWDGAAPPRMTESVEPSERRRRAHDSAAAAIGAAARGPRLDSQCKYALLARGQADVYLRVPMSPAARETAWDHAPGTLLTTEAGCLAGAVTGEPLDFSGPLLPPGRGVMSAPPALFHRLARWSMSRPELPSAPA